MLIFREIKLVYLANPKTGTTSFEHAFERFADHKTSKALPKHVPFRRFRRKFPELARECEIVTSVRDPLDTLYSWYRYRARPALRGHVNSTFGLAFEAFLCEWCKAEPASFADVGASVGFVLNEKGEISKRLKIFRYEERSSLQKHVAAKLGRDVPELARNVSRAKKDPTALAPIRGTISRYPKLQKAYEIYDRIAFCKGG
ncbi:MAG TPA: gamma-glutamyl kinase [Devosia sp.]|nr:gamma-glutamyl kinase [Devosia sp.]